MNLLKNYSYSYTQNCSEVTIINSHPLKSNTRAEPARNSPTSLYTTHIRNRTHRLRASISSLPLTNSTLSLSILFFFFLPSSSLPLYAKLLQTAEENLQMKPSSPVAAGIYEMTKPRCLPSSRSTYTTSRSRSSSSLALISDYGQCLG